MRTKKCQYSPTEYQLENVSKLVGKEVFAFYFQNYLILMCLKNNYFKIVLKIFSKQIFRQFFSFSNLICFYLLNVQFIILFNKGVALFFKLFVFGIYFKQFDLTAALFLTFFLKKKTEKGFKLTQSRFSVFCLKIFNFKPSLCLFFDRFLFSPYNIII